MSPSSALRYAERVLAILRAGGVPDQLAAAGHQLLIAVVNGFTLDETRGAQSASGEAPVPPSPGAARDYIASLPPGQFPNLTAVADHFADAGPDQRFELLLDLFVDGLAQRAASGQRR